MNKYHLIIPIGMKPEPDKYEKTIARLCAEKFQSDILFVLRGTSTTPDIQVVKTGRRWEIKNVKGLGRHTIEDNLREANHQAENVIISLLRTKMTPQQAEVRIRFYLKRARKNLRHVVLIAKQGRFIDFEF